MTRPETTRTGDDGGRDRTTEVAAGLAGEVAEQPGVSGLEPTLASALLGDDVDGVTVTLHGDTADVDISIRTRADHQARRSAMAVHATARERLRREGLRIGSIDVAVLAVDA